MESIRRADARSSIMRARNCLVTNPESYWAGNMHEAVHHHCKGGSIYPIEECLIFRAFQKGEQCHVDTEVFWRKDGSSFPLEYRSYPITERDTITGAVITFTDITERKRAGEQIAEQAALLDKTRDAIPGPGPERENPLLEQRG